MDLLKDKVALITGAGGGIGRGVARCFAREGAAVLIAELDPVTGAEAELELRQMGARALFVRTDVLSKESVEASIQAAVDSFGGLDILVNNAFVPSEYVLLED
jgi:NAD(P)-dependent dehydrogenase (short-subunit alcohol dehydrogenase family)